MGRVCGTYGERGSCRGLVGKPQEKNNLDDLNIDEMMLKCIFRKQIGRVWTGLIWLRMGT